MEKDMIINVKTNHRKECYLCGGTKFKKKPGSVRDRPELEVFECASCGPDKFKVMVRFIEEIEKALGGVSYDLTKKIRKSCEFSYSLFVVKDIRKGEKFTEENIRSISPGYGLLPKYLKEILGKRGTQAIKKSTPLKWELID